MPRTSMLECLLHAAATPRPSADGGLPPPTPGTALAAGASHLVEAATTEQALARVHAELGADARIIDARRVRRGGLGGFFAKELVQLHAAVEPTTTVGTPGERRDDPAPTSATPAAATVVDAAGAARSAASPSPVDRLLADADAAPEGVDFATYLREQLGTALREPEPAGVAEDGKEPVSEPAATRILDPAPWLSASTAVPPPPLMRAGAGWSDETLLSLGLPSGMVNALEVADVDDDLAWTAAVTDALRPSCRPLPGGPAVAIGPNARRIDVSDLTPDTVVARSEAFLGAVRRDRWVHLVVGGTRWRAGLAHAPSVVSWTRNEDLPEALRCAFELGLVLGFGPGQGGRATRAEPFDVALALRDLVVAS